MNDLVLPLTVALAFLGTFLCALSAYSLRDFSWTKLESICQANGKPARFSLILNRYEDAQLVLDMTSLLLLTAWVVSTLHWSGLSVPATTDWVDWFSYISEVLVLLALMLSIGVGLPWGLSRVMGEWWLFRFWLPIQFLAILHRPSLILLRRMDTIFHRLAGQEPPSDSEKNENVLTEIRTVVSEGQREGALELEASTMIHRVIELQDDDVGSIMTPRTDMVCVQVGATLEEAAHIFLQGGYSRVPLINESPDEVLGILYAKDLLRYLNTDPARPGGQPDLTAIVRKPFYVPDTIGIDALLQTMRREKVHMAMVLDEYGGVAGLVSLEDILEEIVGEIVDEFDRAEEEQIRELASGVREVDARINLYDLNEAMGANFPEGDYDTIAGFVMTRFGRVPRTGEICTWGPYRLTVLEADARKIVKLRIEIDPQPLQPAPTRQ